jgi:hypothetical protein
MWGRCVTLVLLLLCGSLRAFGQGGATGAITGVVQDSSGGAVAGAKVQIVSEATGQVVRDLVTDSSGSFTAPLLPVGSYTVEVSAAGFATTKFTGVLVRVTETSRMTAVLKVAQTAQTVEVTAQVATVDTTSAVTGQALGSTTITELPLPTQNFQQLLTLSSGASSSVYNASQLGRGSVPTNVNGAREDNNQYEIEGISASDYAFGELTYTPVPNTNAIQEFKVSTSLYDASQGRNGGGNINAVLKGGTDHYHFDAWEFFRNTDLDANDFFLNGAGQPRPIQQQNIFGADGGGPLGPNAKLGYFYVNYQGVRQRSSQSPGTFINGSFPILPANRSVPSLLSTFASPATAPTAANPKGCPAVPLAEIDPVAFKLLNFTSNQFGSGSNGFLIPTLPGTAGVTVNPNTCAASVNTAQFIIDRIGRFRDDQFLANWDRAFRDGKDKLSWRFFWSDSETFEPFGGDSFGVQVGVPPFANNLNFPLDIPLRGRFGSINETHIFSTRLVNDFRFGVNIISDLLVNQSPVTATQLGINQPSGTPDVYRFQFGSFAIGPYPTTGQTAISDGFVWSDTLSWIRGPHTLRFGGEIDRTTLRRNLPVADNGLVFFASGVNGISDFQNFLQGSPQFGNFGGGAGYHDYRIPAFSFFVQDDYRLTKTLTLNLGFRTELIGAPYDALCRLGNINPALVSTGQPFVYPTCVSKLGISGFTGTLQHSALNNNYATVPEPRIGLAYDLGGHHTTSIRAGYGIYGIREDLGAVDNVSFTPPFFPTVVPFLPPPGSLACLNFVSQNCNNAPLVAHLGVVSGAFVPVPSFLQGFANNSTGLPTNDTTQTPVYSGSVPTTFAAVVPLHWIAGTTQQWNLTVERTLGHDWFLEAGYVGTKGTHLRATYDPNLATLVGCPGCPASITVKAQNGTPFTITQNTSSNAPARAPFAPLAPSSYEEFAGVSDSEYHALQVTLAHHFSSGLYFQGAYTFSKSIDDVSTASVAFDTRFNNESIASESRGLSDFDRRHRFIGSFVYQLPFFKGREGFVGHALTGWETTGSIILQSGAPFSVFDSAGGTAVAPSSPGTITADFAPGQTCSSAVLPGGVEARLAHYVNPASFMPAPVVGPDGSTGYGDTPRNCFIGPPQKNVDFSLGKVFNFAERQSIRFRAEFFNLFNHPSFANPLSTDVESPGSFAAITQTVSNPRLIQFSLKYSF